MGLKNDRSASYFSEDEATSTLAAGAFDRPAAPKPKNRVLAVAGMDTSPIRIGAWRVDPDREQISKDGQTIKLERRLMQLLLCLAERPGQIF